MKKTLLAVMLSLSMSSAFAIGGVAGGIHFLATHGAAAYMAVAESEFRECDKAPLVLARHKGESGYSFQVTQCEIESNDNIEPVK